MHEADVLVVALLRERELVGAERRGRQAGVVVRRPVRRRPALREGMVGRDQQARLPVEPERRTRGVVEPHVRIRGIGLLEVRASLPRSEERDGVHDPLAEDPAHGVPDMDRGLAAEEPVQIQSGRELRRPRPARPSAAGHRQRRPWSSQSPRAPRLRQPRRRSPAQSGTVSPSWSLLGAESWRDATGAVGPGLPPDRSEFPASMPRRGMDDQPTPMDPDEAERRFAKRLEEAGLPRFASALHDPELDELQLTWDHGLTIHMDLTAPDVSPIDDRERASILGELPNCCAGFIVVDDVPLLVIRGYALAGKAEPPRAHVEWYRRHRRARRSAAPVGRPSMPCVTAPRRRGAPPTAATAGWTRRSRPSSAAREPRVGLSESSLINRLHCSLSRW